MTMRKLFKHVSTGSETFHHEDDHYPEHYVLIWNVGKTWETLINQQKNETLRASTVRLFEKNRSFKFSTLSRRKSLIQFSKQPVLSNLYQFCRFCKIESLIQKKHPLHSHSRPQYPSIWTGCLWLQPDSAHC